MWLIADFEDVFTRNKPKSRMRRLQVVDSLAHVTLGRKNESRETVLVVLDLICPDELILVKILNHTAPSPFHKSQEAVSEFPRLLVWRI